jgi:2-oxoglutarate ferredoxin oxidoreductase subunit gamma
LKEEGILIIDSTYVKQPETKSKVFKIPATESAEKTFGTRVYANMLMLGALKKVTNIVSDDAVEKSIGDTIERKVASTNVRAFRKGKELVQ